MTPKEKAEEIKLMSKDPEMTIHYIIRTLYELKVKPDFKEVKDLINSEINYWLEVLEFIEVK